MSPRRTSDLDVSPFPADFLWGAATAAYQIEGAVHDGGRGPSIWDTFSHTPGMTRDGATGDTACDHYNRWPQDVDLIGELELNAYRLSLSWARLQPSGQGTLNPSGVDFYRKLLEGLRERDIRPFVTLYHWDLPQPLETAGGWPDRVTAQRFADFSGQAVAAFADLAEDWITLNEPWCSAFLGYGSGVHAPGRKRIADAVAAGHHLHLAHGLATQAIRAEQRSARIGVTHIVTDVMPESDSDEDIAATRRYDANSNTFFLEPLTRGTYTDTVLELYGRHGLDGVIQDGDLAAASAPIDFLGVNHYHQVLVSADPNDDHLQARGRYAEPTSTQLGWSVQPQSLRNVLVRIKQEYADLPMYVTENGAAYDDQVSAGGQVQDQDRINYLAGYLAAAGEAIEKGVDLKGYFAWSLLDNFEWAEGYGPRFGLVHVDYETQRRTPKASAYWYRDQIRQHARAVTTDRPGTSRSSRLRD